MRNMWNSEVGRNIRQLRDERGWSQEELARRSGCSWRAVQRWERGHAQPRWDSLTQLAEGFGVDPMTLVGPGGGTTEPIETQIGRMSIQIADLETKLGSLIQKVASHERLLSSEESR